MTTPTPTPPDLDGVEAREDMARPTDPALVSDQAASHLAPSGFDPSRVPVFVFGSNLAGRHGKGAALWARKHRGAVYGQGHGIQGDSYAIPTKGHRLETLPLWMIAGFVDEFMAFARKYWMRQFQLTPIGCGLAGYAREQIEPLFAGAPPNVIWPPEWGARDSDQNPKGGNEVPSRSDASADPKGIAQGGEA